MWRVAILTSLLVSCGSKEVFLQKHPPLYSQPDGCSAGSPWAKELFDIPCRNHDICFRITDKDRYFCDREFRAEMYLICGNNRACRTEAGLMYVAVSLNPRADKIFSNRQRNQKKFEEETTRVVANTADDGG